MLKRLRNFWRKTIYTNLSSYGGQFNKILLKEFSKADSVSIASGYVGLDVLNSYEDKFLKIADAGGVARLLLGMAFYEGLSQKKLDALNQLHERLLQYANYSGVYVAHGRRYHGKVYHFKHGNNSKVYVGSSNFSSSGLKGNIECTVLVEDINQKELLLNFVDELYSPEYSTTINLAKITIPGKKKVVSKSIHDYWKALKKYDVSTINLNSLPYFEFPLSRIAEQEKSNLNAYFGKGRLNKKTGVITPRPWYEIELIADNNLTKHPLYPHGDFDAYTDDGYIIPMRTQGDYYKNIRSKNSLQVFGMWLKGKLEKNGVLQKYEPVTADTLEEYGTSKMFFYKIAENRYYLKF